MYGSKKLHFTVSSQKLYIVEKISDNMNAVKISLVNKENLRHQNISTVIFYVCHKNIRLCNPKKKLIIVRVKTIQFFKKKIISSLVYVLERMTLYLEGCNKIFEEKKIRRHLCCVKSSSGEMILAEIKYEFFYSMYRSYVLSRESS